MKELWKIAIGLAGIASVGAYVFYALYKEWLHLKALANLPPGQRFKLFKLFLVLTFVFAIATLLLYAYTKKVEANVKLGSLPIVGKDSVAIGRVTAPVGDRSVVVGATDSNGNTIITNPMAVGYNAQAGPGSIAIGANARAGVSLDRSTGTIVQSSVASNGISQLMVNSPGGVQSVTLNQTRNLIHSFGIGVTIDRVTPPLAPDERQTSTGIQSAIALFTTNLTRIRFVSDWSWSTHQVNSNKNRVSFNYSPETPTDILGRDIEFLKEIDVIAFNYSGFFTGEESATLSISLLINGLEMGPISIATPAGALKAGQGNANVRGAFQQIPDRYQAIIAQRKVN
jgi:hypothetical protein